MLRIRNLFLLLFCFALATPLLAQVVADPDGFSYDDVPTGVIFNEDMTLSNEGGNEVQFSINIETLDDERMGLNRDNRSDPDDLGYEWRDNLEDDGPEYEWIDISEFDGVQQQVLSDDQLSNRFDFGWDFPFYGEFFDGGWACSDGWVSLLRNEYARSVPSFPLADQSWYATVLWADGDWHGSLDGGGPLLFWTNEQDMAIFTFNQWSSRYDGPNADIQVIFQDNGMITIQYGADFGNGNRFDNGHYGSEVGINGIDGQHGFQIVAPNEGEGYLVEGRAIGIGPANAWLSWVAVEPTEGAIRAGDDADLVVTFNTVGVEEGVYEANINVVLDGDDVIVPVSMSVVGGPAIYSEMQGYDFGDVYINNATPAIIPVENVGQDVLIIEGIESDNPDVFFAEEQNEWVIEAGQTMDITIFANLPEVGEAAGILTVVSNAINMPEVNFPVTANGQLVPVIAIEPNAIELGLNTGDMREEVISVMNDGGSRLDFSIESEIISEPDRDARVRDVRRVGQAGPQRDEVDLDGMMFAVLQDGQAWQWLDDLMMERDPLLNRDENYVTFRNADAWNDIDFEEYDVIVYAGNNQSANYNQEYNNNFERFCEYLDGGGAAYSETADQNAGILPPGGFRNDGPSANNGVLIVSPDPNADNYSLLAEIFHESQPDFWNEGEIIEGSSFLHSSYTMNQFDEALDNGDIEWYEWIATPQGNAATAGVISYGFGGGAVMLVGHPIGYGWQSFAQDGQWGSMCAEVLYYLTEMTGAKWLTFEPAEGSLEAGENMDVFVTFNAEGLFGGMYEAEMYFISNDPQNDVVVVSISLEVTGAPNLHVEWEEDFGFPEVIDWNLAYQDLFSGGPYDMPVMLENDGTEDLVIDDIYCENVAFTAAFEDEIVLAPGESTEMIFTFDVAAEDNGDYNGVMVISSNDVGDPEIEIALHAEALLPPVMDLSTNAIELDLNTGDIAEDAITVMNDGDAVLRFNVDYEIISEPGRDVRVRDVRRVGQAGPQRDDVDLNGMMFAVLQDQSSWGWLDDVMMERDPQLNRDENYVTFRNADAWNEIDFDEYDAIVYAGNRQSANYNQAYNNNFERFCEYLDDGGAAYAETADQNATILPPGGFLNNAGGTSNGTLRVSPDPNADNYSLLAEICHESQPNFWNEGEVIEGSAWLHSSYPIAQFDEALDNGDIEWYDWIATPENNNVAAGAIAYGFGGGAVMLVGHPIGHCWQNYNQDGMWGSVAAEILYYLTEMTGGKWLTFEPAEGELAAGEDMDVFVTLDATGLFGGDYEADMTFFSNDPANPEAIVNVLIHVTGAPNLYVEWDEDFGFPEVIDWNLAYQDLFSGGPYDMSVMLENDGTEDLVIDDIYSENVAFTAAFDNEIVLAPGESTEMIFTFDVAAEDNGDYNGVMVISSNDVGDPEIEIALHAEASLPPIIVVEPNLIEDALNTGDIQEHILNIANDGDALLRYAISHEVTLEPGRDAQVRDVRRVGQVGPQRDEVNLDGMMFAVIQDGGGWGWLDDVMMERDPLLNRDQNYVTFRNADAWENINFEEYDAIVYAGNDQSGNYNQAYNNNFERFCEYLDGGGAAYSETADPNAGILPPGGFVNDQRGTSNGSLRVSPDPGADNYSLFAEICHESQPNNWVEGEVIEGNSWLHSSYSIAQFDEALDNGDIEWYDWIATPENNNAAAGAIAYGIGGGSVMLVGHPIGHCWQNWTEDGQWGSIAAEILYYLTEMNGGKWLTYEPTEGELAAGADIDITVTLDATGLFDGDYEAIIFIENNDPANPLVEIAVALSVEGAPDIVPEWAEAAGFPNEVNWNNVNDDVFSGGDYTIPVTINNDGTDLLLVEGIESDNVEVFRCEPNDGFEVEIGESVVVNFIMNAEENGIHNGTMTIFSNDPGDPEFAIALVAESTSPPTIVVDPNGIEDDLLEGVIEDYIINIANEGAVELRWYSDVEVISEPGRDAKVRDVRLVGEAGPRRDDAGEMIETFQWNQAPVSRYKAGIAWDWDNELMLLTTYSPNQMGVVDPANDYEVIREWQPACNPMGAAWLDGVFYCVGWANRFLFRYDIEGNNLGNWGNSYPTAVATSQELGLIFIGSGEGNRDIEVWTPEGDRVGTIARANYAQYINNTNQRSLCWVDKHPDGQLWINSPGHSWQVHIDTDEWVADATVADFANGGSEEWDGMGHDGHNLWFGGYGLDHYRIFDDGVAETYWLAWDPQEGALQPNADQDVVVTLDATGLIGGLYSAELYFYSNDPIAEEGVPDVTVSIEMTVTGQGRIMVEPGGTEEGNEPVDFGIVYLGYPETFVTTIYNVGTDVLTVEDYETDNDAFFVSEDVEFPINVDIDGSFELPIIFDPSDVAERQEATLTFITNDGGWVDGYPVLCVGDGLDAPIIVVDPNLIERAMGEAESEEFVINVANDGGSDLIFDTDFEVISEPARDVRVRDVRRISRGPVANVSYNEVANDPKAASVTGIAPAISKEASAEWNNAPRRDEPVELRVLLLKTAADNGYGWGDDNTWLEVFNNQAEEVVLADIEGVADINLDDFDLVGTGEDQSAAFYQAFNNNREVFEEYVDGGGMFAIFTGSNAFQAINLFSDDGDVPVANGPHGDWGEVNDMFRSDNDETVLIEGIEEEYPILTPFEYFRDDQESQDRRRNVMRGNSLNYSTIQLADLPEDAVWYYRPQQDENTTILAEWPYGNGNVLFTGITGTLFYRENWLWSSMMECVNLTLWADGGSARWFSWEPQDGVIAPGADVDIVCTINTEGLMGGDYEGIFSILSNDPETPVSEVMVNLAVSGQSFLTAEEPYIPQPLDGAGDVVFDPAYANMGDASVVVINLINNGSLEVAVDGFEVSGDNADDFTVDLPDGFIVPARNEAEIEFVFTPTELGIRNATITLMTDAMNVEDGLVWWDVSGLGQLPPSIIVDVEELHESMMLDDEPVDHVFHIGNAEGEFRRDLVFEIDVEENEVARDAAVRDVRNVRGIGPQRDDVDLNGMMFAVLQDQASWGWLDDVMMEQEPLLNRDENYVTFRDGNAWNDIDFDAYDAIVYAGSRQSATYNQAYNDNFERFCDYLDGGGAAYAETADQNATILPPGGFLNNAGGTSNGTLRVSPDPNADNYSLFAEICHESQPNNWEEGEVIEGNSWLHSSYPIAQFDEALDNGDIEWYDWIATPENNNVAAGAIAYGFGGGSVMLVGHPIGHCWQNWTEDGQWGSIAAEILYYLTDMNGVNWLAVEPDEGIVVAGAEVEITATFNVDGLENEMLYEGTVRISSNDPDGDVEIPVTLRTGVPELVHFTDFDATNLVHTLQVEGLAFNGENCPLGWEIGVFNPDDVLSGAVVWEGNGTIDLPAYGAEGELAGFVAGDRFNFKVWDFDADMEWDAQAEFVDGPAIWNSQAVSTISLSAFSMAEQTLHLNDSWNMISVNVDPVDCYVREEGPDVRLMFAQLADEEGNQAVEILKDEAGNFWAPAWNDFINIPFWNLTEGYQVKMIGDAEAVISGNPIPANADIPIGPNWNLIAYFPNYDLDASDPDFYVLSPIIDNIQLAKNGGGNFMVPSWEYSNMPPWTAGQGYQVKSIAEEEIIFNYPAEQNVMAASVKESQRRFTAPVSTGENMSILINSINGVKLGEGDQIIARNASGEIVGIGNVNHDRCGIAIWGDDKTTEMVDGLRTGEAFSLKLWDADQEVEIDVEVSMLRLGKGLVYGADDFVVIDVNAASVIPTEYYLTQNFPNPFNSITRMTYGMPEAGNVSIKVFDVTGRIVTELINGKVNAGQHIIAWDASTAPAGIYMVRMETATGFNNVRKVMLVK